MNLIYRMEPKTKKWKKVKLKSKSGYAQKCRETVRGIRGVREKQGWEGQSGIFLLASYLQPMRSVASYNFSRVFLVF